MAGWSLILFTGLFLNGLEAAKILAVFPTPSISHQVVFRPITQELARRGHQVVVITPDPTFESGKAPENLTEIDTHNISYSLLGRRSYSIGRKEDLEYQLDLFVEKVFAESFFRQLQMNEVKEVLQEKFDLILVEACVRPTLALSHIIKAPLIMISSFGKMIGGEHIIGAPYHPKLYPVFVQQKLNNLTFWEKIKELYMLFKISRSYDRIETVEDRRLQEILPGIPPLSKLKDNVDMMFLNEHPIWDHNRPVPPNVVYMAGILKKQAVGLPTDLQAYLDSSSNGVIYLSFGTNALPSFLPPEKIKIFMDVFSQLPYDILFKWDLDELPGRPENVKIMKWLPQVDILKHPKVKLFITQGGLQSTEEALSAGVPLIGIPMLADQWYNAENYVQHKIGLHLDLETLTEEDLRKGIVNVIEDKSFRKNIVRLQKLIEDSPQQPLERVMWWIEYVLRHGGAAHLRSPAANMSWVEYLELQFLFTLLAIIFGATFTLVYIYHLIARNFSTKIKIKIS